MKKKVAQHQKPFIFYR